MHLPRRAEIAEGLAREYDATPAQISTVMTGVYLFRAVGVAIPLGLLVGLAPALEALRPLFFVGLLVVLVPLVAWQVIAGWVGTVQVVRGRGDRTMATFLVTFIQLGWAFPRRGPRPISPSSDQAG